MKLIFLWIKKYYQFTEQGFNFSANHKVSFEYNIDENQGRITIENQNTHNIYGEKISDITAIVGENGSGKTTLAKAIHAKCSNITPIIKVEGMDQFNRKLGNSSEYIAVFEMGNTYKCYYYLDDKNLIYDETLIDKKIVLVNCGDEELIGDKYRDEIDNYNITSIYFSNAFDMNLSNETDGIVGSFHEGENCVYNSITLGDKLIGSLNKQRKAYGGGTLNGYLVNPLINTYAEFMERNINDSYLNLLAQDVINIYKNQQLNAFDFLPEDIFKRVTFTPKLFADGIETNLTNLINLNDMELKMAIVLYIMENHKKNATDSKNFAEIVLYNTVCEFILFSNLWGEIDLAKFIEENFKGQNTPDIIGIQEPEDKLTIGNVFKKFADNIKYNDNSMGITYEQKQVLKLVEQIITKNQLNIEDINFSYEYAFHENIKNTHWYEEASSLADTMKDIELKSVENLKFELDLTSNFAQIIYKNTKNMHSIILRNINFANIPMSTGENALITMLSSIYTLLVPKENGSATQNKENVLLIIDEIDVYLHPRWQQEILNKLLKWINAEKAFRNKVQIIITSHSPIILSDFTSDRVIKLSGGINYSEKNKIFGANIQSLYYDNFFMKKGSIGEISKTIISAVIDFLDGKTSIIKDAEQAKWIIEEIGEELVRKALLKKLQMKNKEKNNLEKLIDKIGEEKALEILKESQLGGEKHD